MSNDICTMYTKEQTIRKGYVFFKREIIPVNKYGEFLNGRRKRKRQKVLK